MNKTSLALMGLLFSVPAYAATYNISNVDSSLVSASTTGNGGLSIVSYDGSDALRLTTGFANEDEAGVRIESNFGNFGTLLMDSNLGFEYRFQKASVVGGNAFASAAFSFSLYDENFSDGVDNDGFVTIKYEHYWNTGNTSVDENDWITATMDFNSGAFWANGGLGLANGAGGPPLFTLQDIIDGKTSANANLSGNGVYDFNALMDADIVSIGVSVGSYNQGQEAYVDFMALTTSAGTDTYNFQVASVPVPAAAWLFGSAIIGLVGSKRQRAKK
jgi:hypothetical protein